MRHIDLYKEINRRRADAGQEPISREYFVEIISGMSVKGQIVIENDEVEARRERCRQIISEGISE